MKRRVVLPVLIGVMLVAAVLMSGCTLEAKGTLTGSGSEPAELNLDAYAAVDWTGWTGLDQPPITMGGDFKFSDPGYTPIDISDIRGKVLKYLGTQAVGEFRGQKDKSVYGVFTVKTSIPDMPFAQDEFIDMYVNHYEDLPGWLDQFEDEIVCDGAAVTLWFGEEYDPDEYYESYYLPADYENSDWIKGKVTREGWKEDILALPPGLPLS